MAQKFELVDPSDQDRNYNGDSRLYQNKFSSTVEFLIHEYVIKDLKTQSQSQMIQEKAARFSIEVSEGLFEPLDPELNPFV